MVPTDTHPALTWSLSLLFLLVPCIAYAVEDLGLPAPPFASDTLRDDGSAMLTNPANLTFQPGVDAGLGAHATSTLMQGDGAYTFVNYTAPFRLSIGVGVAARFGDDRGMTGFASLGWGAGPFAMALRYRVYQAAHHPMHGVSTSDFALTLRPTSFMSFSAVFTNLWTPKVSATERLTRSYRIESGWKLPHGRFGAALQWIGDDIGLGYNHALALHTEARIARGLHLFASGSGRITSANAAAADAAPDFRISGGLSMQTGALGSNVGVHGVGASNQSNAVGASALLQYRSTPKESVAYRSGQLLKVSLSGKIHDRPSRRLFGGQEKSLSDLLMLLRNAERSAQVDGVYLHLSGLQAGVAQLWEIRQALDAIRETGRHVVVYLEEGGLRDLYLAAAGDYIMASPAFVSQDAGLRVERFYIADLLERLGIDATFVRVGEYKSAVETFTRSGPSKESDEALHGYMKDVWAVISRGLCDNRPTSACPNGSFPLDTLISANSLYAARWINALGYEDELPKRLAQHFKERLEPMSTQDLVDPYDDRWEPQARIAVLHIDGAIVGGKSGTNVLTGSPFTGASTVEHAAKDIREDGSVRGVIVRINSPGGSVFASDEMHRALTLLQESGLPIVFSFSDSAASGGYYVSALRAPIYSAPTTLTGSIGIYAGSFSLEQLLGNIGVNRTSDAVGGPSKLYSTRAWDETDKAWMQASIQHGYDRFQALVAKGRDMTIPEVERLAGGRVWSGQAARENGLVDHIGGFMDAYDALCDDLRRCRRDPYPIKHYGQVVSLNIPFALASVLGVDSHDAGTKEIRAILEQVGLGAVFEPILTLAPTRAREARADLGGLFRVTFE